MVPDVATHPLRMYRSARMWRSALLCGGLTLAVACSPKQVESPLEKAPPAGISEARDLRAAGDLLGAENAYEKFIVEHPGTAEADLARLELGILEAELERCPRAIPHFEQASDSSDQAIALRAALRLASCQLELGDPERALATLEPVAKERFAPDEQELLWETALSASEQTLAAAPALRTLDLLLEHGGPPPDPQRVWATAQSLAGKATIDEANQLFETLSPGGVPQAAIAVRLLDEGMAAEDSAAVARAADALRASEAVALSEVTIAIARADEFLHGNPYSVGALLPMTGRGREVGRQLLQGMQLAQLEEGGPELAVEDAAADAEAASGQLVGPSGVVAVLGPVGSRAAEAASQAAERSGVPMVTFAASEDVTDAGEQVFRFAYSPRDEAAALVQQARKAGLSRFIVLHPDNGYGRTLERLFDQEVSTAGGVACEAVPYPPGTKSFVEYVRTAIETTCNTVLLADVADQVALIAPTFAAEGVWSVSDGQLPSGADQEVHFLLPSPSWSPELLRRAGRYLGGARIALPFYASASDPAVERFRVAYETRYGSAPGSFAAYGYDAYRLVSAAIRQGAQTRAALSSSLMEGLRIETVTSIEGFAPDRTPLAPPAVYRIVGNTLERER